MAKKLVKKRKLRIFRLLLVFLILGVLVFAIDLYLNTSIKNITITGTKYLKDDYILNLAGIEDYPSFYFTTSSKIKNKIKKSPYIKKITVNKGFYHTLNISIKENQALFTYEVNHTVVLENNKEVKLTEEIDNFRVPRLMNYVPNTKYKTLIKDTLKIKKDILGKISEMTYVPNEYDKDRFLLYMDDGNSVYLTLTKFKMINYYNEVLTQLSGKKGILYLDSGNHFKIME